MASPSPVPVWAVGLACTIGALASGLGALPFCVWRTWRTFDGPGGRREHDEEEGVLFSTDVPPWALGRAQGNDFEEVGDEEDDSPVAGFEEGGGLPRDPFATYDDADVFAAALDIDRAPDGGYGGLSFEI